MGVKKRYLVICLMLLLMVIGGVAASEDASDDAVKARDDNATLTVENKIVEEDNLALDGGSDSEEIESDDSNDENVLSASNENDVLGNTVYDTGVSPTITALNSFVTGNTVSNGDDVILTQNYVTGTGTAAGANVKFKSITGNLNGAGGAVTLNMNGGTYRFFNVPASSTVTFENIIFKNSKVTEGDGAVGGGAIVVGNGATVTFINCVFEGCQASFRGGAIYFGTGCNAKFTNCSFNNNRVETTNGANDLETTGGGAIHFAGNTANVEFTNCSFDSNHVHSNYNHDRAYAGAICFEGTATNNRFINCTFSKNYADATTAGGHRGHPSGGAIYFKTTASGIDFKGCNFNSNYLKGNFSAGDVHSYITYAWGGAVCFNTDADDITFEDSEFEGNSALSDGPECSSYGGAFCILGEASDIHITNVTFHKNSVFAQNSRTDGGAASWQRTASATSYGGAVYLGVAKSNINIVGCTFDDNHANKGKLGKSMTGAIFLGGTSLSTINIKDTLFTRNTADDDYGVINFNVPVSSSSFINVTFDNNTGTTAPLYFGSTVSTTKIINSTFTNNENTKTTGPGVGIYVKEAVDLTISGTTFAYNIASSPRGSALFIESGNGAHVDNCTFAHQTVSGAGSAIYWGATNNFITHNSHFIENTGTTGSTIYFASNPSSIEIYDSQFRNNEITAGSGGALNVPTGTSNLVIDGCNFDSNKASVNAAGVYIPDNTNIAVTINNSTFVNNDRNNGRGGAIYSGSTGTFTVTDSTFRDNNAQYGSTIYFASAPSSLTVTGTNFTRNTVTSAAGGALSIHDSTPKVTIKGCTFDANGAAQDGAAVYIPSSSMTASIDNSTFINQYSDGDGAAIYWGTTYKFTTSNSIFKNNHAVKGATIYFANSVSAIDIKDTEFIDNEVMGGNGGALDIPSSATSTNIKNCTFEGNSASSNAGAVYVNSNNVKITDSDFSANTAGDTANAVNVYKHVSSNSISSSKFNGDNQIYVDEGTSLSLTKNNQTSSSTGNYMLYSFKATLALSGNNFTNVIINENGVITNKTYANVSGNKTYDSYGYQFPINATIVDDNNNSIISYAFQFTTNYGDSYPAEDNLLHRSSMITSYELYYVGGKDAGLQDLYVYNATIWTYPPVGSYTWLQVELDKAGSTYSLTRNVTFNPSYDLSQYNRYHGIINFTNGMLINKVLTLNGNGNTISGLNQARIFNITSSGVSISNTKFVNATASKGGALYIKEGVGSLTLTKCSFEDNHADVGGAIYHNGNGNTINIIDSSFNANTANEGGAIQFNAASAQSYAYITIRGSNFTNNKAFSSSLGGSAVSLNRATEVEISNSKFDSNFAAGIGAVIFDYCTNVEVTLCNFISNNATENAGAIYFKRDGSGFYTVSLSNFTNNKARNGGAVYIDDCSGVEIKNSKFTLNKATNDASAIYSNKDMMVVDCEFEENTASNAGTIKLYNERDSKISGSVFTRNNAATAAAIWATGNGVQITKSNFTSNKATGEAGAVYFDSAGLIEYCNFTSNSATNGAAVVLTKDTPLQYSYFEDNHATGNGTIYIKSIGVRTTVLSSTFIDNDALNGGAIYYVTTEMAPDLYILYSDFINNTAEHNGGAIYYVFAGNVLYRDYHNFDDRGEIVLEKTSVKFVHGSDVFGDRIAGCGFTNNRDYNFNVTANPRNQTSYITISLTDKVDVFSAEVNITLISLNGTVITRLFNPSNFSRYYNPTFAYFQYAFPGLENDTNYTVKASFSDKKYVFKNETITFITGHGNMGEFAYLQSLIDKAIKNPQETINGIPVLNLTGESFTFNEYDKSQMHINETIIINLNGGTISAEGMCRIFNITAKNVILMNIRFVNGNVEGNGSFNDTNMNGGAIYWCGENGTVMGSDFDHNFAHYGGGIYFNSSAADCKIVSCTFDDNTAKYNGGAIDCNATKMNLNHTTFKYNVAEYGAALCREANADGGFGYDNTFIANHALIAGAALGWMNSSKISIDTYYFYDNYADQMGGAIYVGNGSGECEILNCEFERNYVVNATNGHGGAIDWFATKGKIYNSRFEDNWAHDGGALYIHTSSGNITIEESNFIKNKAINGLGGAVNLEASAITVNRTNFTQNIANEGGAIYGGAKGTTNYFYTCLFDGNVANATGGHGGAIDDASSSGRIYNSILINNRADYGGAIYVGGDSQNCEVFNSKFINNAAKHNGGAIDLNATGGGLTNVEFTGNTAEYGGALCREEGAVGGYGSGCGFISNHATKSGAATAWIGSKYIYITDYFFYNNTAEVSGGAIYGGNGSEVCFIADSVFIENSVSNGPGGAMYLVTGTSTIKNTTFTGNHAVDGGAIYASADSGNANVTNTTFNSNYATNNGGAINLQASTVTLNDTHFNYNSAKNGGAVYVGANGLTNYVYSSTFNENYANGGKGGAINWMASAGHILDSNITNNHADYGAGIYLGGDSENSVISHVIFDNNEAKFDGGAIDWNATRGNLTHTIFKNNKAQYGAALCREAGATGGFGYNNTFESNHAYISGAALAWMGSEGININTYTFNDNWADVSGGAIYIATNSPSCVINNSQFNRNYVSNPDGGYGGAIACLADNATVINTTFDDNHAFEGGAIYVGGAGQTSTIQSSSFTNNKATGGNGGAIDWVTSTGNILDSNFTENSAINGGAVYIGGNSQNSKISHVIFDSNKATKNGGAIDWNATAGNLTHTKFINNEADYGAALCREANSGGGFGFNNTFIGNHARISGAALAWLGTHGIKIDTYYFYNNTATVSGGSIYVDKGSDECKVLNSIFSGSKVRDGRGGDIDWIGERGYILNTTFSHSESSYGGSIYVDESSSKTQIINSSFTDCFSFGPAGAVAWLGDNGKLINVNFTNMTAFTSGGAIYGSGDDMEITNVLINYATSAVAYRDVYTDYLSGSGICWVNANNLKVTDSSIKNIKTYADGAGIAAVNCNGSEINNVTILGAISLKNGGSIYWVNSTNLNIEDCDFIDTAASFGGGALYLSNVDTTIKDSKFNHTQVPWGPGGAIYADADVKIINSTFERYEAQNNNATAIYFKSGISHVDESTFKGINPIFIFEDANVTLVKNNITESDKGMYSVWNDGNLWLNNNKFDSYIYNNGSIWTKTYTYMLDGKVYNVTWMEDFNFFATIYDDTHENKIISVDTLNTTNDVYQDAGGSYILPYNQKTLKAIYQGSFKLKPSDVGLKDNTCFNGTLNVKMPLNLNLTVNYVGDDKITVTATITPVGERSNFTLQNKIIFRFNSQDYEEDINWDEVFHDPFHTWTKAVATFELNNLSAGYYKLTAMYPGDDTHEYAENMTEFEIKLRETWIKVVVENITYGSYAIANVTTNGNGTVLLFLNGRYEKYNLTEGDGYYGNYSIVNGTLIVKFDTLYGPGNYSMAAVYMEDEYYRYALNQTNFTVFKQNTTIIANATNITFWGNETINVTVDANATGYIIITIPVRGVDQNYVAEIDENGTAHFIIPNLFGGDYKNIRVFYAGDHNFNGNVTYINFTVAPTDVYDMDVKADNITYGQNATVRVLVPSLCDGNVTIWVDGKKVGTVNIVNGVGVLDNVSGLAGGKHYANATYNGDANYAAKNFTNVEFNVNPTINWKLTITVDEHAYGENTTVYVTANPYNVTNRNLTIYIGNHPYVVNITNGVATLTLSNITAGIHESHAYYSGDANYSNKTQKFRLHVVKAQPTVNLTFTNENKVIANVTGLNVTGNVTFYVNGRNVTVNVNNNIAVLENLPVGNN